MDDYWIEHAEIAMNESGLTATEEQLDTIAGVIESAHEFFGQSHGHDVASHNFNAAQEQEAENLKKAMRDEQSKIRCSDCLGTGQFISKRGSGHIELHGMKCPSCNGEGRI